MANYISEYKELSIKLYKVMRKMGVSRNNVSLNTNILNDLLFDNYDMNIFLFLIESKFNIEVNENDVIKLTTIGHTLNFIEEKLDVA
jgi:acyl carrier protein